MRVADGRIGVVVRDTQLEALPDLDPDLDPDPDAHTQEPTDGA